MYIGVSKPCGILLDSEYVVRPKNTSYLLADIDHCSFDKFNPSKLKTEEMYQETGLEVSELSVFVDNFLI